MIHAKMKNAESCPLCKSNNIIVLYENHISLYKCRECRVIFNRKYKIFKYDDDYFTNQYRKQYGKTYIEDFENIYRTSISRLKRILKLTKKQINIRFRLLDLGSAMGFFLKAACDKGIKDILGIEISGYAAGYCAEKFGINVINASFSDIELPGQFDIITAWYFLEHCYDPINIVRKIFSSLNPKGIFAFSIPSFFGPQFLINRDEWFKLHPKDHRVDFSPSVVRKFLKKIGFNKVYTYPGGIHPERIIDHDSIFYRPFKIIYHAISRLFSFSDTLEVYAVK